MDGLLSLLAPDATWTADSGGKATAAPPAGGRRREGGRGDHRALPRGAAHRTCGSRWRSATARPRWSSTRGDHLEGVFLIEIIDGKITNLYAMRNPDKLAAIAVPRTISR